jgi:hypothetical protein
MNRPLPLKNLNPLTAFVFCFLFLLTCHACVRENPPQKQSASPSPAAATSETSPAAAPSPAQEGSSFPKGFFSVKGIALWTSLTDVIKPLGQPIKTKRWTEKDTMMPGEHMKLDYVGLSLDFYKDPPKDFYIWKMGVSGKNWSISPGLQVGMEINEVQKKLKPLDLQRSSGEDSMSACGLLEGTDACIWIKFKESIVTEIGIMEDWS